MDEVLITGASGFMGLHVTRALAQEGRFRVIAPLRGPAYKALGRDLASLGVLPYEGEFLDPDLLKRVFGSQKIRHVLHFAALRGPGKGTREAYLEVNVAGTERLLQAALGHGVARFLHVSSVGIYGTIPRETPAGEGAPLCGDNAYHLSKILAEACVTGYAPRGLGVCILRPAITYGKGDRGFATSLRRLVARRLLPLPRRGTRIHLLSIGRLTDLCRHLLETAGAVPPVLNVADPGPVTLGALVDLIHRHQHGRAYPGALRLPRGLFSLLHALAAGLRSDAWKTRVALLSRDWTYDTSRLEALGIPGEPTLKAFGRYLQGDM